jgi:hypothetical protein
MPGLEQELCIVTFRRSGALIEAVYRREVEKLAAAERKFAEAMPPIERLRAWMLLFVDKNPLRKTINSEQFFLVPEVDTNS